MRTTSYFEAARRLDEHLATCASCGPDGPCERGYDIAEAEFRSWRQLQRTNPDVAERQQARWSTW